LDNSHDFVEKNEKFHFTLDTMVSTDAKGVVECLGLNAEANVELIGRYYCTVRDKAKS
jgi:hypothetical protein